MTNTTTGSLRELQRIDDRIRALRTKIQDFDPLLAAVEEPALRLESELAQVRTRLEQMRTDTRRLEGSADDKRARATRLDERLNRVSNLREEAAVGTELDLIRRAIEADEHEALQLLDQIRRTELAEQELAAAADAARADVEPQQESLLAGREKLKERRAELEARRETVLGGLGGRERRVYESFHASGRTVVIASLTEDGACSNCFGMVPLQLQNEIRRDTVLLQCEACGVILTAEPEDAPGVREDDDDLATAEEVGARVSQAPDADAEPDEGDGGAEADAERAVGDGGS